MIIIIMKIIKNNDAKIQFKINVLQMFVFFN